MIATLIAALHAQSRSAHRFTSESARHPKRVGAKRRWYYYENALGRAGSPSQVAAYQTALDTGAASPAGVADTVFASQEFQSDEAAESNAAYIDKVYQVALGRDPEPAGYAAWEAALAQEASRVGVAEGIVASSEFAEKVTQPMEAEFVAAMRKLLHAVYSVAKSRTRFEPRLVTG